MHKSVFHFNLWETVNNGWIKNPKKTILQKLDKMDNKIDTERTTTNILKFFTLLKTCQMVSENLPQSPTTKQP